MAETNLPADGEWGQPPPDAPREWSQPLQADLIAEQQAKARQNERALKPLDFVPTKVNPLTKTDPQAASHAVQAPAAVQAASVARTPAPVVAPPADHQPAASNTDSPSRGAPGTAPVPSARAKAPLRILGGFGEAEAEYFPLDGHELRLLVEVLLDELYNRVQNDLRFSVAMTYPRLKATLQLLVEGELEETGFAIERVVVKDQTPVAVAQERGDSVVFVLVAKRREFDDHGEVESPANAIREEIGVEIPRKQQIENGLGKMLADVRW